MADTAISGLADGSTVQTSDQIGVNRSGSNFRVVVGALATKTLAALTDLATGTANRLIGYNGSGDPAEIAIAGDAALAAGVLTVTTEVSTDTSPVLGGDLTMSGNALVTTSNGDVLLSPNGSGAVSVSEVTDYENNVTTDDDIPNKKFCDDTYLKPVESIIIAASDETTALTTGTAKVTFRMPYAFTLTDVRASVTTAPTGAILIVDINEAGSTIMTTNKLSIDATEFTSTTAATAPGLTDTSLADDAEITIDIDQIGSTIAGAGLKVTLIGNRT